MRKEDQVLFLKKVSITILLARLSEDENYDINFFPFDLTSWYFN